METKGGYDLNIEIKNLGFSYPSGRQIFDNLSFRVEEGQILSVLGPNGAGKSTLLGCIANLLSPKTGDIFLDGKTLRKMSQKKVARFLGFVPQNIQPSFDYSVLEYVVTGCAPRMGVFQKPKESEYRAAWGAIEKMKLGPLADKSFMRISSGERQQAAIARVIAQRTRFILLDEPTAHLDVGNQMKVLEILKDLSDKGYGVVMTTHNPDHVLLLGGDVAVLDGRGGFTYGPGKEIIEESFLFKLYGAKLRVLEIEDLHRKVCVAQGID